MSFSYGIIFTPAVNVTPFHYTLASRHGEGLVGPVPCLGGGDQVLDCAGGQAGHLDQFLL